MSNSREAVKATMAGNIISLPVLRHIIPGFIADGILASEDADLKAKILKSRLETVIARDREERIKISGSAKLNP